MATVFQRCKDDKRSVHYPCTKTKCGHGWTVRYRDPAGAERQLSFEKKPEADALAAKLQHDKYEGLYLDPQGGKITVRAYAEDWLERQIISESTRSNYQSFLRIHLVPRLGRKTIAGVSRRDIEAFIAAISEKLAPSTVYDRMKLVRFMFYAAMREHRRTDNPCDDIKIPGLAARAVDEDTIPTLDEVDLLAKQISGQYRLTVYLQAGAGLRIGETLALGPDCRRSGFLRVRWQVSAKAHRQDCRARFVPLKHRGEGAYRDVPLPAFLDEEIDAHVQQWGTRTESGREVFFAPHDRGKTTMPNANTYSYHFRKAQKDAGLVTADGKPLYTPHRLRHFFASTALAQGIPIHEVSRWLGHKSIKTTVDIYGHLIPAAWDRCRETMHNALRPGG